MSIIYVPPNRNSFWQQINNGTGLYGLAMSQLVKGFMNGVNERHKAYIDKQIKDRQAGQLDAAWQYMKNNRGTHDETTYNPVEAPQYQPQSKLEAMALEPAKYSDSLNPNVFEQNRQKAALQDSLNQPMQNLVDNAWNNVEGRGINTQTVQNPLDYSLFMDAVTSAKLSPEMMSDLYKVMQKEIENNADLASRQRTAQAVQGMAEPTDTRGLVAMDALSGKGTAVNAYNAINPGYTVNSFNNGSEQGIAKTDKRTGETTFDYGKPYGISAQKAMEDRTKREIHYSPSGSTVYAQAQQNARQDKTLGSIKPNQQMQAGLYGQRLAQMYGNDPDTLNAIMSQYSPEMQGYIGVGAYAPMVYDPLTGYKANPNVKKTTAPQAQTAPQPKAQGTWKQPQTQVSDEQVNRVIEAARNNPNGSIAKKIQGKSRAQIAQMLSQ